MNDEITKEGMSRRGFLGMLGVGVGVAGVAAFGSLGDLAFGEGESRRTILFDGTKCIGCHYCEGACKKANGLKVSVTYNIDALADTVFPRNVLPFELMEKTKRSGVVSTDDRTAARYLRVVTISNEDSSISTRHSCTHCGLCAQVCPSGTITQRKDGIVEVNPERCIGCKYCYQACPFNIPRFNEEDDDRTIRKCDMCAARVDEGGMPACVEMCPAGALRFGTFRAAQAAGQTAAEEARGRGFPNARLYGAEELGGMGVLYVLPDDPRACGMPRV